MTEAKPGFISQLKSFPATFYVANTMEIFERMAWYGMLTPLPLYLNATIKQGGLGLTEEQAGSIIGLVTFLLYLMPVFTGALADRIGYKKMFILAFSMMVPCYYIMGAMQSYNAFLIAFLALAVGAAIFKPVVVGTVARTSNEKNSQLAFGIFYMMVNIGGFIGPLIAGAMRNRKTAEGLPDWRALFTYPAIFIGINLFWVIFFYREPTTESKSANRRTLGRVLADAVEVLGNARFFICIFGILIAFFAAGKHLVTWAQTGWFAAAWLGINLILDAIIRSSTQPGDLTRTQTSSVSSTSARGQGKPVVLNYAGVQTVRDERPWFRQPMRLSNWRFGLYLLILSGFWTSFNQILQSGTLQWYIRDFCQTKDLFAPLTKVYEWVGLSGWATEVRAEAAAGRQFNPEWISNLDPAAIVIFQLVISVIVQKLGRFRGMVIGILIAAIGIALPAMAGSGAVGQLTHSGWLIVTAVLIFAIGEMMASPTSQEYISTFAPPDKVALYMGYYFIAVALGNLFGGVLAGNLYGALARDRGRPDIMWAIFGVMSVATAVALALYNRFAVPKATRNATAVANA